jgi:hypothetical protein
MVECYVCDKYFEPSAEALKAWAESQAPFWPEDWRCDDCRRAEDELAELADSVEREE